jgi:hypothetical protein
MKIFLLYLTLGMVWLGSAANAVGQSGSWQALKNQPGFSPENAYLLTDGTVMVHQYQSSNWYVLTPDQTGNYVNGTWSTAPSVMPNGYAPGYYASAVLADGNLLIEGGEFNGGNTVYTNQGALYSPFTGNWLPVNPPPATLQGDGTHVSMVGNASAMVAPNGTFIMNESYVPPLDCPGGLFGIVCLPDEPIFAFNEAVAKAGGAQPWTLLNSQQQVISLDGTNYSATVTEKQVFALLPNGSFVTATPSTPPPQGGTPTNALSIFDFATNSFSRLPATAPNTASYDGIYWQFGPIVLRQDGSVVVFGGNGDPNIQWGGYPLPVGNYVCNIPSAASASCSSWVFNYGNFNFANKTYSNPNGPLFMALTQAVLLPSGDILAVTATGDPDASNQGTTNFQLFYGPNSGNIKNTFSSLLPAPTSASSVHGSDSRMLLLPTGQVMWTRGDGQGGDGRVNADVEIFTETGASVYPNSAPTISFITNSIFNPPTRNIARGSTYLIGGTQFNGLSQASSLSDGGQNATNYPLVKIVTNKYHTTYMCRTHDHSTMGVATGSNPVFTGFDVPSKVRLTDLGPATLYVIANGVQSQGYAITLQ